MPLQTIVNCKSYLITFPNLSPTIQEALTMLNIRVKDLLTQLNTTLNLFVKANIELKQQMQQYQKTTNIPT